MPRSTEHEDKLMGTLHLCLGAWSLIGGAVIVILLAKSGSLTAHGGLMELAGRLGMGLASVLLLLSGPGLLAGAGLLRGKRWAPCLALFVSILNLPILPLGSAVGGYTLWNYWNQAPCPAPSPSGVEGGADLPLAALH